MPANSRWDLIQRLKRYYDCVTSCECGVGLHSWSNWGSGCSSAGRS